jgi:hypothetical protein
MVKVRYLCSRYKGNNSYFRQRWGYSDKIGPVFYDDDDAAMLSPAKKDEIESEVRRYVEQIRSPLYSPSVDQLIPG